MKNFLIGISLILLLTSCAAQRYVVNSPAESTTSRSKTESQAFVFGGLIVGGTAFSDAVLIAHPPRESGDPIIPIAKRNLANECNGIDNVEYIEHRTDIGSALFNFISFLGLYITAHEAKIVCN